MVIMKKILLLLVAAAMSLNICAMAAAEKQSPDNIQAVMSTLGIMNGDQYGNLNLEDAVTRAEFTKMAVMASNYKNMVAYGTPTSPFLDVTYTHWAAPYIKTASVYKIVTGYPDSTFAPENGVLVEEAATIALKLIGYTDDDFSTAWPYGQMGVAQNIGLLDDVNCPMNQAMSRGQVRQLIYNMLICKTKGSEDMYINSLDYKYIEDVTLIATSNEYSGVGAGKVLTSEGTYTINSYFDASNVGRRGDAVINDKSELILFFPSEQRAEAYNIYSVVGSKVVLYRDGEIAPVEIDTDITVYYKGQPNTLSLMLSSINPGDAITLFYDENGVLDYATMSDSSLIGPVTVKSENWAAELGISETASVTRDGAVSSIGAVKNYDVIYYSPNLNSVWVYSKKVTGVYEKASPSKEQISTITLSGVTYDVNSVAAFAALGSNGGFKIGDTVTLLIGRDGSVADAVAFTDISDVDSYVVYSALGNDIVVYDNGNLKPLNLDSTTTAYFESNKTTVGSVTAQLEMGYIISVCRNTDGSIDYVTINSAKINGPVTNIGSNWKSALSVSDGASVIRDGKSSSASAIAEYDVVYYSSAMNMVWAYSKKVSGVYEQASPNRETVTSVTVAGTSYSVETAAAMKKLSSSGDFALGDNVVLLIGKDGGVADVISPDETSKTAVYGYLVSTGNKEFKDENGNIITSPYVELALPDGTVNTYKSRSIYDNQRCSVVKLNFDDGVASVTKVSSSYNVSGKFSYSAKTLGTSIIADDIKILDVGTVSASDTGIYAAVFPQRLDGVTIYSSDVLYCERNAKNEITALILKDVTGDSYKYGVVASVNKDSGQYTVMIGTESQTISSGNVTYSVSSGQPAKFKYNGTQLDSIVRLNKLDESITDVTHSYLTTSSGKYMLADNVVVYNSTNSSSSGIYKVMPVDDIIGNNDYRLEAYYDKRPENGGRIRVIKAYEK